MSKREEQRAVPQATIRSRCWFGTRNHSAAIFSPAPPFAGHHPLHLPSIVTCWLEPSHLLFVSLRRFLFCLWIHPTILHRKSLWQQNAICCHEPNKIFML